ncbi:MAG: hypothetical protein AAGA57_08935 [Planctomycetota bacterium]
MTPPLPDAGSPALPPDAAECLVLAGAPPRPGGEGASGRAWALLSAVTSRRCAGVLIASDAAMSLDDYRRLRKRCVWVGLAQRVGRRTQSRTLARTVGDALRLLRPSSVLACDAALAGYATPAPGRRVLVDMDGCASERRGRSWRRSGRPGPDAVAARHADVVLVNHAALRGRVQAEAVAVVPTDDAGLIVAWLDGSPVRIETPVRVPPAAVLTGAAGKVRRAA